MAGQSLNKKYKKQKYSQIYIKYRNFGLTSYRLVDKLKLLFGAAESWLSAVSAVKAAFAQKEKYENILLQKLLRMRKNRLLHWDGNTLNQVKGEKL